LYIEVIPPFSLPDDLSGLIVWVKAPVVDLQEFFAALHILRQTGECLRDVTERRHPQDGDIVFLDVRATYAGRIVPGLGAQNLALRLGGKESYPELRRVVRALHVGEEGAILTPCPENYQNPALLGKEIQLNVRLKSLKTEILLALDDAFAAKLGKKDLRTLQEDVYKELLSECSTC
jgi:FKBP-type peptidyl-prolyl cis-trans isomerase (trigger factor)